MFGCSSWSVVKLQYLESWMTVIEHSEAWHILSWYFLIWISHWLFVFILGVQSLLGSVNITNTYIPTKTLVTFCNILLVYSAYRVCLKLIRLQCYHAILYLPYFVSHWRCIDQVRFMTLQFCLNSSRCIATFRRISYIVYTLKLFFHLYILQEAAVSLWSCKVVLSWGNILQRLTCINLLILLQIKPSLCLYISWRCLSIPIITCLFFLLLILTGLCLVASLHVSRSISVF